ncbi:MAG: caspase family protein, partial [Actinomycetia bacterium]|nr:caspase family protein [Actinomycetes bacterium]
MAPRALIIAIENYPHASGLLAKTLPGTHDAARRMFTWLTGARGIAVQNVWVNTDDAGFPAAPGRLSLATGGAIRQSIADLVDDGAGRTDQLFVFFSGHGCSREGIDRYDLPEVMDYLVPSEVAKFDRSPLDLISVPELWKSLQIWLGPGEHYYFIDACRNDVGPVPHAGLRISRDRVVGKPAVYRLNSAGRGAIAATSSGFVGFLVDGLGGRGRAKRWRGQRVGVYFDSLFEHVAGL